MCKLSYLSEHCRTNKLVFIENVLHYSIFCFGALCQGNQAQKNLTYCSAIMSHMPEFCPSGGFKGIQANLFSDGNILLIINYKPMVFTFELLTDNKTTKISLFGINNWVSPLSLCSKFYNGMQIKLSSWSNLAFRIVCWEYILFNVFCFYIYESIFFCCCCYYWQRQ